MAYTREDWNSLIRRVNDVLQNPPQDTDCEPIEPLEEVGPDHIWTKTDIQNLQNKLKETCEEISFSDIPDLWKQSIIDEIENALGQAWCGCDDECTEEKLAPVRALDGLIMPVLTAPSIFIDKVCEPGVIPTTTIKDLINGIQLIPEGFDGAFWRLEVNAGTANVMQWGRTPDGWPISLFADGTWRVLTTGTILCEHKGKVQTIDDRPIPLAWGATQNCTISGYPCDDPNGPCPGSIEAVKALIAGHSPPLQYRLRLTVFSFVTCCPDEEEPDTGP
jgi:hypothetical protein